MTAGHKSTLVTAIMFEIIYLMTPDILVASRSCPTFAFIHKLFLLLQLFHLYSFGFLPFAVTIIKINLSWLTLSMQDKKIKLSNWDSPIVLVLGLIDHLFYLLVVLCNMAEMFPTRCV
jgi:hypothetical protein